MIKVLVCGASGRMGQAVVRAVLGDKELLLVAAVDTCGGKDAGEIAGAGKCGVMINTDLKRALAATRPAVMVDFTQPDAVFSNAMLALEYGVSPVIGTTGMTADEKSQLEKFTIKKKTPAFLAPNFAIGAVLLMLLSCQAAKYMPHMEIIELHHDNKLDAPSGTALQTAALIKKTRANIHQGHSAESEKIAGVRGGQVDGMRIHSVRLPGLVAHQEVIFGGLGQTLTIRHDSFDRESFMPGVVLACKKVCNLTGLVIGLENLLD